MLKSRYRIRCMFFFLLVSGVFLSSCLKAVEYPFTRCFCKSLQEGAYYDENGNIRHHLKRVATEGSIIQEHDSNDARIFRFRLERQSGTHVTDDPQSPCYINIGLSVELLPRDLPNDEDSLIPQLRTRIQGADSRDDPLALILSTLDSLQLPATYRRAFISVIAGRYDARITGFGEAEATSVAEVSFLEELVQLLLIIKSSISSDAQFRQLVSAVRQVSPRLFLPEAMAFNQFFPLVHLNELREQRNNSLEEYCFAADLDLYRDSAMITSSLGLFLCPVPGESGFFLRSLSQDDIHIGRWVRDERPFYFPGEDLVRQWYLSVRAEAQRNEWLPNIQEPPHRFPVPLFDSGYASSQ